MSVLAWCALTFFVGVATTVLWALWVSRPARLSEAQRLRIAEQELQRLTFAATAQMLREVRKNSRGTLR